MSDARDHHFVPQFYLRQFSNDGKSINLFNFRTERTITGASIKGQCQKRGLHDWDPGLEKRIAGLEQFAAKALRRVADAGQPPTLHSSDDFFIKFFIVLQKSRTLKVGEEFDKIFDYRAKWMLSHEMASQGIISHQFKIKSKYPLSAPMYMYVHSGKHIVSLQTHLFINNTNIEFFTRDHPAITHNKYSEAVRNVGVLGLACVGIQLWLPLSSRLLYMVYDQTAYRVGATRKQHVTILNDDREVQNFNDFQIVNSQENIYFRDASLARHIEARAKALGKKRLEKRLQFSRFAREDDDGSRREIMIQHERQAPISLNIASISVQKSKRRIPPTERYKMWRVEPPRYEDEEWWPEEYTRWDSYPVEKIERR